MPLISLDLPSGLLANGTDLQASGHWRTGNLIRWRQGGMEPVGGWQKTSATGVTGKPRAIYTWHIGLKGLRGAIATSAQIYSYDGSDTADITPGALPAGRGDTVPGAGFGAGQFGDSTYGDARTVTGIVFDAATWELDSFGDDLVAVRRDEGTMYKWVSGTDATLVAISNAPSALGLLVTDERHLVAFGAAGDPRKVAWCDREDYTTWAAAATNSAGDLLLSTSGRYIGSVKSRNGVLILTDLDAHVMRFVGQPFVYGIEREAEGCGLFGPNAVLEIELGAAWMGPTGFFLYDGYVRSLPCPIYTHVFRDINAEQGIKIVAGGNIAFDELWWFYPSAGSLENDRYVIWNYREGHWSFGVLARAAWADRGVFSLPLALDPSGYLYSHENGWTDSGAAREDAVYVESAPVTIGSGDHIARVTRLINDSGGGDYRVTVYSKFTPNGEEATWGPYMMRDDGYTDVRLSGRQVRLRIEGATDKRWHVGRLRAEVNAGGKR